MAAENESHTRLFQNIMQQMAQFMGGSETAHMEGSQDSGIGMDMTGFLMDMPLLGVLEFQDQHLPTSPEEMVDNLLKQVFSS